MTKFNKGILASAIAASAMLAGAASAAELGYQSLTQITYAKDLIATDSRTLDLPAGYQVRAVTSSELDNAAGTVNPANGIKNGDTVEIVISLGQGANAAKFQSSYAGMQAAQLLPTILIGEQLGGTAAGLPLSTPALNATVAYSQGDRELRIRYQANADGTNPANAFALRLGSLRVFDLQGALKDGDALNAGISIVNDSKNRSVLAGNAVLARSVWGEEVEFANVSTLSANKWIDVARCGETQAPRTQFSDGGFLQPAGSVSTSCDNLPTDNRFNAGEITLSIAQARTEGLPGAGVLAVVNNYEHPTPWSISASKISYTVTGTDLRAFAGRAWLDTNGNCTRATGQALPLSVSTDGKTASVTYDQASPPSGLGTLFQPLTTGGSVALNVCLAGNGTATLLAQDLEVKVSIDHTVPTLFVNPPDRTSPLYPLRDNVGTFLFQNVNPGDTPSAQSFLRLTNNTAYSCAVTIDAKDDAGKLSGAVKYTLAPHASEQFNTTVLESGVDNQGRAITGKFGDGKGKWYVRVQPECADFTASALNRNQTDGTVSNLTTEKNAQWLTPTELLNP